MKKKKKEFFSLYVTTLEKCGGFRPKGNTGMTKVTPTGTKLNNKGRGRRKE